MMWNCFIPFIGSLFYWEAPNLILGEVIPILPFFMEKEPGPLNLPEVQEPPLHCWISPLGSQLGVQDILGNIKNILGSLGGRSIVQHGNTAQAAGGMFFHHIFLI